MSWRSTRATGGAGQDVRRVAVIDLGSNSWRVVIYMFARNGAPPGSAESRAWFKLTDEIYETVRIGSGLAETGRLG